MKKIFFACALCLLAGITACTPSASLPGQYTDCDSLPVIYPDYVDVTVPRNIAPLTFRMEAEETEVVARLKVGAREWVIGGEEGVCPSKEEWNEIKQCALKADGRVDVEVFATPQATDNWRRYRTFQIHISPDSIDPWISYRLISPSYVTYENLTINQRCLENFDESLIYGNMINTTEKDGQCINCHAYQNYDPNRMQFHVRQHLGGTLIALDGRVEKHAIGTILDVTADGDTVRGSGVYPAWHPTLPLIAYSSNKTGQTFYTYDPQKVEVQDTYSDLILYDIANRKVTPLERDTNDLDCFPTWSPDGKYLYYCSAHYEKHDSTPSVNKEMDLIQNYRDVHYNLYRRAFNEKERTFGPRQLVYDAAADSMSATLPRISPDGTKLLFTLGRYGIFHIWHNSSDLCMIDLTQNLAQDKEGADKAEVEGKAEVAGKDEVASKAEPTIGLQPCIFARPRNLAEVNSDDVESWHCWSSNGRWIIFSSRRYDGNFTRPLIAHMKADGTFERPFELPQANPNFHRTFMRSYNLPEFMRGPVTLTPQELAKVVQGK